MNIYLLMEGSKTEPLVYNAWINYVAPHMSQVKKLSDIKENNFYIISSQGYPRILTHAIADTVKDINQTPNIDALWIVVDTENSTIEQRLQAIQTELEKYTFSRPIEIQMVVQKCCIETWGFGNDKVFPTHDIDEDPQEYLDFYDIRYNDPEEMKCPDDYDGSIADYHLHYLRAILKKKRISYTKSRPNDLDKEYYFNEICVRESRDNHLLTFRHLKNLLHTI